tara:strand:+ start:6818 stop:7288 length:471 start_codon:yes stop_codon:yes gene_type:complete
MIEENMKKWHLHLKGQLPGGLDELIDEDCVFYSPVVFTAQKGKALTKMYLNAAGGTFNDDKGKDKGKDSAKNGPEPQATLAKMPKSKFRYSKEIMSGNQAVLEFESEVDGKYVNGVDILTWNDAGKIVEFKVMIRPLQAVNAMHQQMGEMLEKMKG